jgi:hypothetical protein
VTHRDAPKGGRSGDRFGRAAFAENLASLLYDAENQKATGLVVGLTGPWGSGKSQTLLYVKEFLDERVVQKPLLVMHYNPWLFSGRETMIATFLQALSALMDDEAYTRRFPELKELKSHFDRLKESFGDIVRKGASVDSRAKAVADILLDSGSLEKQKESWAKKLEEKHVSVVVIIDELDRLTDDEIRGMVQVVKSVADFPTISYLLAYDPDRVARALGGNDLKFGHNYLEKIVQVQTRLPRISEAKMKEFIKAELPPTAASDPSVEAIVEELVPEIIYTPRDARRFVAAFEARKFVLGEVDKCDLLEYCALESRIPVISERLQNLATRVSVDGCRELSRRWDELLPTNDCIDRILDVFKDDVALRRLLLRLLPALDEAGAEETVRDDRRLCYETSLLSLLNYGIVPKAISNSETRAALENPDERLPALLNKACGNDCVRQANLRLRTIARELNLDPEKSRQLWGAIAAFFDRPITEPDMASWMPWIDVSHVWVRGALLNYLPNHPMMGREAARQFVKKLLDDKNLQLASQILYFHLQAHGLLGAEPRPNLHSQLEADDTHELVEMAARSFRDHIIGGSAWSLRSRLPLLIVKCGSERHWEDVSHHLSNPASKLFTDGIAVLLLRTRREKFQDKALYELLDVATIAKAWRRHKGPTEERRKPVEFAYRFLHSLK